MGSYPITYKINLSILKTAKLLQTLVDVAGMEGGSNGDSSSNSSNSSNNSNMPKLPESIELCVAKALSVQKELVKEVDKYLHYARRTVDEIKAVTSIVEICPEFLATKGNYARLPIHSFACSRIEEAASEYVPLLAEIGRKHGIGGVEGRGGLTVKDGMGYTALEYLTAQKSSNVIKKLKCSDPPLLVKEDVCNYGLLGSALRYQNIEIVKQMVQLDPSCLHHNHRRYGVPLRKVSNGPYRMCEERRKKRLKIVKYLLQEAVSYDPLNPTIGGLFFKDADDKLILDVLIEKLGPEDTWSFIKQALSSFVDLPILHKTIEYSPQHVQRVITQFPKSVFVRDIHNRLPVHVALECGLGWGLELLCMMNANSSQLKDVDPVTKRPPFVLAALDETSSCDLSTVYFLLRENPAHVEIFLSKMRKKKYNFEDDDSPGNKRRKTN